MTAAIEVGNLSKTFDRFKALNDISLKIEPGEMVALIGASGSGKSSLLRHVAGFVTADSGAIAVMRRSVQKDGRLAKNIRQIRTGIGFIFRQFNLVGRLPVITNVMVGLLHRASSPRSKPSASVASAPSTPRCSGEPLQRSARHSRRRV